MKTPGAIVGAVLLAGLFPGPSLTGQTPGGALVWGRVLATSDSLALGGVQVFVEGTGLGVLTDSEGRFSIRGVAVGRTVLRFKHPMYAAGVVEIEAGVGGTQVPVVVLRPTHDPPS